MTGPEQRDAVTLICVSRIRHSRVRPLFLVAFIIRMPSLQIRYPKSIGRLTQGMPLVLVEHRMSFWLAGPVIKTEMLWASGNPDHLFINLVPHFREGEVGNVTRGHRDACVILSFLRIITAMKFHFGTRPKKRKISC